jgi:hypothetical protein
MNRRRTDRPHPFRTFLLGFVVIVCVAAASVWCGVIWGIYG